MKNLHHIPFVIALTWPWAASVNAFSLDEAIADGKTNVHFNLRYESSEQDNAPDDASALTLRSRLGFTTAEIRGFSAMWEIEDVRIVGNQGDYSLNATAYHPGKYSTIADPETTELDQGYIRYDNKLITAKLGRQVITHDQHRFIGDVGWRQDRQTFDGLTIELKPSDKLTVGYNYINQRNRIFAEVADLTSKDHLIHAAYETPIGTFTGYRYRLEIDNDTDNLLDTVGANVRGTWDFDRVKLLYVVEFASQDSEQAEIDYSADYLFIETGVEFKNISGKLSYEVLGSDGGDYGFQTPLATLHKFNGWADLFLSTPSVGLVDTYATLSGKLEEGKVTLIYHQFEADDANPLVDDLGKEIDIIYTQKFGKHYVFGTKYAAYSAGDDDAGKVDTDKFWLWLSASF